MIIALVWSCIAVTTYDAVFSFHTENPIYAKRAAHFTAAIRTKFHFVLTPFEFDH